MISVKVQCACGQKYSFEVEPIHGRMPGPVACPVCGADGTAAANEMLRQTAPPSTASTPVPVPSLASPPAAAPAMRMPVAASAALALAPAPAPVRPPAPAPTRAPSPVPALARSSAPAPAAESDPAPAAPVSPLARLSQAADSVQDAEKWKWWYFVLAGICIGGYSIWQSYTQHRIQPLGELFLAVFCIAIGIWDFQHKRKKKRARG